MGHGPGKGAICTPRRRKEKKRVRGVINEKGGLTITLVLTATEILLVQAIIASTRGQKGKVVKRLNRLRWQYVY